MLKILILLFSSGCFAEEWMNSTAFSPEWNETEASNLTDSLIENISMQNEKSKSPELLFVHAVITVFFLKKFFHCCSSILYIII